MTPSEHATLSKIVVIAIGAWQVELKRQYHELDRILLDTWFAPRDCLEPLRERFQEDAARVVAATEQKLTSGPLKDE